MEARTVHEVHVVRALLSFYDRLNLKAFEDDQKAFNNVLDTVSEILENVRVDKDQAIRKVSLEEFIRVHTDLLETISESALSTDAEASRRGCAVLMTAIVTATTKALEFVFFILSFCSQHMKT